MSKISAGDKVNRDVATASRGSVRLGDMAPVFTRPIRAGDKVVRDDTTKSDGKVRVGDMSPVFQK